MYYNVDTYNYNLSQRENCTDLSNSENPIKEFSSILFSKSINQLEISSCGLIMDGITKPCDLCCMLLELALNGLDILSQGMCNIFDLDNVDNNFINLIDKYLGKVGFTMKIKKVSLSELVFKDYFCLLKKKQNNDSTFMDYKLVYNSDFEHNDKEALSLYKIIFINNLDQSNFVVTFDCVIIV